MKTFKLLLLAIAALVYPTIFAQSAGFPQLSDETEEYWYYLKFTQGTFVVSSNGENVVCKALIPSGKDCQLWKVEGSKTSGYTFTNKLGLQLYLTATDQGSEVRAAAAPSSLNRFKINASGSNYTISPSSNSGQAFNVWGGMGLRNDIKLYNSNDANAPMVFLAEEEVNLSGGDASLIPYPYSVKKGEGVYDLHQLKGLEVHPTSIAVPSGFPQDVSPLLFLAERLKEDLHRTAGINVPIKTDETAEWVGFNMVVDEGLGAEAYSLSITADGIMVKAADYGGFFNGLQTLRQLMPTAIFGQKAAPDAEWVVPCMNIEDAPAMSHRGFHLDISRHFFDKNEVKKLLDAASTYKLNRFHWHLTDDQGWRIEIPEFPKLTTVGAIRKASLTICDQSGDRFFDDTEYGRGCYYTLDDLSEIVAYAAERNIQIIPEVDMPGHMTACIVAYPELGCTPEKEIEVMTEGGISRDILNIGKDETIDFLKCVLGHLAEVFPYELVHLGGDECPTTAWQSNADCQRRIKEEGLGGVNGLQPWLVETLGCFLRDKYGKTVVVWDELLANWKNSYTVKPVVMSWRGVEYASQAADRGLHSIMVPTSPLYFDYLQVSRDQLETNCPYNAPYGTINSVEKVYNFDPRSTVSGREQYVLGTQANLWTESCTSNREAEYQYYPRLLALSEIAWLPTNKKDFISFYNRLQHHASVLRAKEITYAPHYFEPVELSPAEAAIAEAEEILANSSPGSVGYPQLSEAEALRTALDALRAAPNDPSTLNAKLSTLNAQLATYKAAPIILPEADRLYQIVSASTYYRYRFDGSTLYTKGNGLAIHYTAQTEPEELWQFLPQDDGTFQIVSVHTGNALTFPKSTGAIKTDSPTGSSLVIRKATKPAGGFSYIPGVVNIKQGRYNLYAKLDGRSISLTASIDSTLCYPGTWRIVEVSDYRYWLQQLVEKAERLLADTDPHAIGQPTEEALQFLAANVLTPARERLAQDEVSREDYLAIAELYAQFRSMKVNAVTDFIDPSRYYLIRNSYYSDFYATSNNKNILAKTSSNDDVQRWYFVINDDGTVSIYNKKTDSPAYVTSSAEDQNIRLGRDYHWTLAEVTTDQGNTDIAIIDKSGVYSWYSYSTSGNILLKPYEYGASVWQLIKTDEEIRTGITEFSPSSSTLNSPPSTLNWYDLTARPLLKLPPHGVFIQNGRLMCK